MPLTLNAKNGPGDDQLSERLEAIVGSGAGPMPETKYPSSTIFPFLLWSLLIKIEFIIGNLGEHSGSNGTNAAVQPGVEGDGWVSCRLLL